MTYDGLGDAVGIGDQSRDQSLIASGAHLGTRLRCTMVLEEQILDFNDLKPVTL
jgi:hypothetical protein